MSDIPIIKLQTKCQTARNRFIDKTHSTQCLSVNNFSLADIRKNRLAGIREKWLEEGTVEVTVRRINMQGPPGAGKTCTLNLLLNRPVPPNESTPIACRAVKATRVSCTDGQNIIWEEIDNKKLLEMLADDLCNTDQHQPDDSYDDSSEAVAATPTNVATPNKTLERIANRLDNPDVIPKELSKEWMYIVDSGGQPAYQELLPLFTRAPSLNIIVLDLTKGAKDEIQFHYRKEGDEKYPIPSNEKYTNIEYFAKVIKSGAILPSSILTTNEEPKSEESKSEEPHPYYFVIGTHYDVLRPNDHSINDKLEEVNRALLDLPEELKSKVVSDKNEPFVHAINATEEDKKRKESSEKLCNCILGCGVTPHTFEMPTRWFAFELSLLDEAGDNGFLTMKKVYAVGRSLKMNREDTNDALKYLDNVTTIIHYPDANLDKVFVDPQPILDALSSLLALTYVESVALYDRHLIMGKDVSGDEVKDLKQKGMFKKELIDKLKLNVNFLTDDFIKLLCHLYVIAKIDDYNYFIPCALPPFSDLSIMQKMDTH